MQLSQKISVSLDPSTLRFIDRYATEHAAKGRSAVVAKALKLLELTEQESRLAQAYAQSARNDKELAAAFEGTLADGLVSAQVSAQAIPQGGHAAW